MSHYGWTCRRGAGSIEPGFDLVSNEGTRYQVKVRTPSTLNVDVNNFDFDYLILVNLSDDYRMTGIWRLGVDKARSLFTHREKFRKHQATQKAVKDAAEPLEFVAERPGTSVTKESEDMGYTLRRFRVYECILDAHMPLEESPSLSGPK